jgi:putative salt-induced outer membrane protein YdiY
VPKRGSRLLFHVLSSWKRIAKERPILLKRSVVFLFGFCMVAIGAGFAEQVMLKNGDRLTGTVISMDGKKLVLKTTYAGEVSIDWAEVNRFSSDNLPLVVTKGDKQVMSGTVATEGANVVVTTAQGAQTIPRTEVATMRSPADQAAYEKSLHPGIMEGWAGGGNFGFALARGNSDTTNLALGFNAARKTSKDMWTVNAASLYSTDHKLNVTTANSFIGLIRYDRNISKRWFVFGMFSGMYDELQQLNYRFLPAGGLGFHAIATDRTTLDLLGGFGYTRESYYNGTVNNLATATLGDEFVYKISKTTTFTQNLYYLPSLNQPVYVPFPGQSHPSNYRVNFTAGIATKLNGWMTANVNFLDQYVSQPVPGNTKNNVVFTTGLGFTFGKPAK